MPIVISDYVWSQTLDTLSLSLDLKRTNHKDVDIIYTKSYIKVNFSPYFFEIFLYQNINIEESVVRLTGEKIAFTLKKATNEEWPSLSIKLDKEKAYRVRQEALEEFQQTQKQLAKQRKENHTSCDRHSVSEQLTLEDEIRNQRKQINQLQKVQFFANIDNDEIRRRHSSTCSEEGLNRTVNELDYDGDEEGEDSHYQNTSDNTIVKQSPNRKQKKSSSVVRTLTNKNRNNKKNDILALPPIRTEGKIIVDFTPRLFPTPSRESKEAEELKILESQLKPKPKNQGNLDLDFLKKKAASLFGNGDYEGSVNAFTEAIKLSPANYSLYSNRAAAYLSLDKNTLALQDCTKALNLMLPYTKDKLRSRTICLTRRGTAFCRLHKYHLAFSDYQLAASLEPDNLSLAKDAENIRLKMASLTTTTETEETGDDEPPAEVLPRSQ